LLIFYYRLKIAVVLLRNAILSYIFFKITVLQVDLQPDLQGGTVPFSQKSLYISMIYFAKGNHVEVITNLKKRRPCILPLVGITFEALACYDYLNGKSVVYDEYQPVQYVMIILLFLSILFFWIKWSIITQLWSYHIKTFLNAKYLETATPTSIYKLIWAVQLLLHNAVLKDSNEIYLKGIYYEY